MSNSVANLSPDNNQLKLVNSEVLLTTGPAIPKQAFSILLGLKTSPSSSVAAWKNC